MNKEDNDGKLELSLRILGNEIIGFQDEMDVTWISCYRNDIMDHGYFWSSNNGDV